MNLQGKTIVVGMSGGVDSSVTAYLLKCAGARVIGLFMKNWEEEESEGSAACSAAKDFEDVTLVCNKLEIPYYAVNFSKEYWNQVFAPCLDEFSLGNTPNPDILCNREIKFQCLLQKALELGAEALATGHYARLLSTSEGVCLARGLDSHKDQSYFLYALKREQLERVYFPLGELHKEEVRRIAAEQGLATATKKDSVGICFIGKRDFKEFLSGFIEKRRGHFETPEGEIVGEHEGAHFYTVGQRRGIGIGGEGKPWFVVDKDMQRNVVLVVQGEEHPALYKSTLKAKEVSWVGNAPALPYRCTAKIRYRSSDVPCRLYAGSDPNRVEVHFETPQKAATAGQSIVFYQEEICLGGGIIEAATLR